MLIWPLTLFFKNSQSAGRSKSYRPMASHGLPVGVLVAPKVNDPWPPVASRGLPWPPMASPPKVTNPWPPMASYSLPWPPMASRCGTGRPKSCRPMASHGLPGPPSGALVAPKVTNPWPPMASQYMASLWGTGRAKSYRSIASRGLPWPPSGVVALKFTVPWPSVSCHGLPVGYLSPHKLPIRGLPWPP